MIALRTPRYLWLGLGLSTLFALAQLRLMLMLFGDRYASNVEAAQGVLLGQPHWRTYQPRVLGPWLIEMISHVLPSFFAAYIAFSIVTLTAMGFLAWRLGWRVGGGLGAALLALFVCEASFSLLLSPPWFYAWDYLDILIFLVFVDFIAAGRPWHWFVVLLAFGIYSRETAAFIAVWLILEAVARPYFARPRNVRAARPDMPMLIAGIVCLILSVVAMETVTRALFIEEIGPKIFLDAPRGDSGQVQPMHIVTNFNFILDAFNILKPGMNFLIPIYLAVSMALAVCIMRADGRRYFALGLTYIAHQVATVAFGYLGETRIFVEDIPLLVLGALILSVGQERSASKL